MTDTRDEAVEVPLTEEQVEALSVGFGCLLPPTEIYKLGYRAAYATLSRQLVEAQAERDEARRNVVFAKRDLDEQKQLLIGAHNRHRSDLAEARRELAEWKEGNRAHVAAENVANERRKEAERQLAVAQAALRQIELNARDGDPLTQKLGWVAREALAQTAAMGTTDDRR